MLQTCPALRNLPAAARLCRAINIYIVHDNYGCVAAEFEGEFGSRVCEAPSIRILPTRVLPVKEIFFSFGCCNMAVPIYLTRHLRGSQHPQECLLLSMRK